MSEPQQDMHRFLPESYGAAFRSEFARIYEGQSVCVAGAGGYIGSALVKALGQEQLRSLVVLESSEHGLFEIQRQMETYCPSSPCEYILGNINDGRLLGSVFGRFRPQVIFHAAAFKHVALLEHNPSAALMNNVVGTYTLVRTAMDYGVSRFVLLSTDKAVNPHSVMGVSKRMAEMVTVSLSSRTCGASAIRLGNVIGSTGSVIPIFLDQIAKGGRVTVTHTDVSRYFLSREQATTAILAAGVAGCDGMILVPDLGAPVLIADLARFLITTSSRSATAEIAFTGLRPGEKLTEDLVKGSERQVGMTEGSLNVFETERLSTPECEQAIARLLACLADVDQRELIRFACEFVPEYVPSKLMRDSIGSRS